jgi:hypothetical protein
MRNRGIMFIVFLAVAAILAQSCEKEGGNRTNISQANGHSHNAGRDCMQCHISGGEGAGWFNAAGTVYNTSDSATTYTNAVVKLYTAPDSLGNQVLVATINGDGSGNFYTTASIDYGAGLYPVVVGAHSIKYMPMSTNKGACNSCHGVNTARIIAN